MPLAYADRPFEQLFRLMPNARQAVLKPVLRARNRSSTISRATRARIRDADARTFAATRAATRYVDRGPHALQPPSRSATAPTTCSRSSKDGRRRDRRSVTSCADRRGSRTIRCDRQGVRALYLRPPSSSLMPSRTLRDRRRRGLLSHADRARRTAVSAEAPVGCGGPGAAGRPDPRRSLPFRDGDRGIARCNFVAAR